MVNLKVAGNQRWKLGGIVGSLILFFGVSYVLKQSLTSHGNLTLLYAASRFVLAGLLSLWMFSFFKTAKLTTPSRIGFQRPIRIWLGLIVIFFASLLVLKLNIIFAAGLKLGQLFNIALIAISAGVYEEVLCRGLLFSYFLGVFRSKKHVLLWTAVASSLIFGLLHLSHLFYGQSVQTTLQQVFYAFVIGLAFSAIRISTNGIWVGMIIHSLIDFDPLINLQTQGNGNWLGYLIIFTPLLIISLLYLVKVNRLLSHQEPLK